jgi:hypothetical protein
VEVWLTPGLGTQAIPTASKRLISPLHPLYSGPLVIPGATSCLGGYQRELPKQLAGAPTMNTEPRLGVVDYL